MAFEDGDILKFNNYFYIVKGNVFDEYFKDYSYRTDRLGWKDGSHFIFAKKAINLSPGTDGHKGAFEAKEVLFDYIFTELERVTYVKS